MPVAITATVCPHQCTLQKHTTTSKKKSNQDVSRHHTVQGPKEQFFVIILAMSAKYSVFGPLGIYKAVEAVRLVQLRTHHFLSSFLDVTSIYIFLFNKRKAAIITVEASQVVSHVSITTYDVIKTWLNIAHLL